MLVSIFQGGGIRNKTGFDIPSQAGSLTYTGNSQSPTWRNYSSLYMTIGGTTSATNAGSYTATFTLIDTRMYQWKDGTTEAKAVTWTINKVSLTVPSQSGSLTYTGSSQSPTWRNYDSSTMTISGTTSATAAGTYTATFTLNDTTNYQWSDGTTSSKSVTWTINKVSLTVPSQSGSLTYTGSSQSPTWRNYDSSTMTIGGTTSATAAGTYTATFTLKDTTNYQWSDGTTSTKSVTWTIAAAASKTQLTVPSQSGTLTYTGSRQSPSWNNYNSSRLTIGGTTSATNAGTYTATFTINDTSLYEWTDGTTETKSVTWTINKLTVAIPYLQYIPYDYTNYYYYYQWDGDVYVATDSLVYDSDHSEITSGTMRASDEGTYYIGFRLSNTSNYQWADDWPDRNGPGSIYPSYDYYLIWAIVKY